MPKRKPKILANGVDSLYCFLECTNVIDLSGLTKALESTLPGEMFDWHGVEFLRVGRYLKGFPCCAQWMQFQLFFNKSQLYIQFLSLSFELFGMQGAIDKLCQLLEKMRNAGDRYPWIEKLKVSRIDVFCDIAYNGEFYLENFRTRLRKHGFFQSGKDGEGKTFYYGTRSDILIRLYVKSSEIKISGKSYLKSAWAEFGCENDRIWRFEGEIHKNKIIEVIQKRELMHFDSKTVKTLLSYAVEQFQAVEASGDSNLSRRPLHPVWVEMQKEFDLPYNIQKREVGIADIGYRWKRARPWVRSWLIAQGVEFDKIPEAYRRDFKLDEKSYMSDLRIYQKMME